MLVFIDESGDAGFKFDKGSTRNFVIGCVIFQDRIDAEEAALEIKKLKRDLCKKDGFEFKFNKCSPEIRKEFLKRVARCKFKYIALVMEKDKIYDPKIKRSDESFYKFSVKQALKHSFGAITDAVIYIDSTGDRSFRKQMGTYLRKSVNKHSKIVRDVKFRNSNNDYLIQLADMVAGAINRSFSDKNDRNHYRNVIKRHEERVWPYPTGIRGIGAPPILDDPKHATIR